jgi:hypothetical protein
VVNTTTVSVNQLDPTLSDEMNYLHIGPDVDSNIPKENDLNELNEDQEINNSDEVSIPMISSSSVPVVIDRKASEPSRAISHPKAHLNTPSSPPWSWQWGGLPERRSKEGEDMIDFKKDRILKNRSSTPLLRNVDESLPLSASGIMTIQEKVGNYLESGIPPPLDSLSAAPPTGTLNVSVMGV